MSFVKHPKKESYLNVAHIIDFSVFEETIKFSDIIRNIKDKATKERFLELIEKEEYEEATEKELENLEDIKKIYSPTPRWCIEYTLSSLRETKMEIGDYGEQYTTYYHKKVTWKMSKKDIDKIVFQLSGVPK